MYKHRNKALASILVLLVISLLVASIPQTKAQAQFILASEAWEFDEYGQGFYNYTVWENITLDGEWNNVGAIYSYNDTHIFDWNVSYFIKIYIYAWMNSTLTSAIDVDSNSSRNLNRVNVTVTAITAGTTVFSADNLTCDYSSDYWDPVMWLYGWDIILDFEPDYGEVYVVTFTQEVFW